MFFITIFRSLTIDRKIRLQAKTITLLKGLCIMKTSLCPLLLSSLFAASALAQTAPAPVAAPKAARSVAAPPAPAVAKTTPVAAPKAARPVAAPPAPAVAKTAPGQVWVNGTVYHCPGAKHFGTTKTGQYMSEQAAIAAGAHASHNRSCAK
jgi:hypothetical protein